MAGLRLVCRRFRALRRRCGDFDGDETGDGAADGGCGGGVSETSSSSPSMTMISVTSLTVLPPSPQGNECEGKAERAAEATMAPPRRLDMVGKSDESLEFFVRDALQI